MEDYIMKIRFAAGILALSLVMGTLNAGTPAGTYAANTTGNRTHITLASNEETQEKMTEVLLKIKTKLELPEEFTEFSYNYNDYGEKATWYFNWSTADSTRNINVSCDDDAHILYLNSYDDKRANGMPDRTADELLSTVEDLIACVFPEAKGHVVLKDSYYQYYRAAYRFTYYRIENGIEMPDNYVVITVGCDNGELMNAECSWNYTAKIPSADKLISVEEAAAAIDKKLDMQLYYYVTTDADGKDRVYLAYTPSMSYIAVNAANGKLYTKKNYWGSDPEMAADEGLNSGSAAMDSKSARGYEPTLSDAEIKRIKELNDLISSDDAVKIIRNNKYLLVDANANAVTANLREINGKYIWIITLNDNRPEDYENGDYYRAYARATVDASNGRILSFSASIKSLYYYAQENIEGISFSYSKKDCKNVFEKFVKSIESDKFAQVKLTSSEPMSETTYVNDSEITRKMAYAFEYTRYNDEVPFASNGIYGSVDRVTGKVYNYRVNWTDAEIPSAKDVIGEDEAYKAYLGYKGFDLVYEIVNKYEDNGGLYGYENEQIVRLVYRTAISPAFVDAFTGKQLDYSGEEYENVRVDYKYSDIEGTKYEKAIKILAGMGIGLPGEKFEPAKGITGAELAELISKMPAFGYRDLKDILSGDEVLTREQAARALVEVMGFGYIAKLDIYKLSYSDSAKVTKGYEGYVAIAGAMGLFGNAEAKNFKPQTELTRGEAAELLINAANEAAKAAR